jgi:xanthine dehydrogenase accessory factor
VQNELELCSRALRLQAERQRSVVVTVVETHGSTPRKAGARMLWRPGEAAAGIIEGTIGGGAVEHAVRDKARAVLARGRAELVAIDLGRDLGMGCGGRMTFFMEPVVPEPVLLMFGCGHIGSAVLRLAQPLGFSLYGIDDLASNTAPLGDIARIVGSYDTAAYHDLPADADTFVVIATREHALDRRMVTFWAPRPVGYVGVIGSQRKAKEQRRALEEAGLAPAVLDRIRCPVGIDIGAETPAEIALSICAELVAVRRGGTRHPLRKPENSDSE